jgi:hypothetical protein
MKLVDFLGNTWLDLVTMSNNKSGSLAGMQGSGIDSPVQDDPGSGLNESILNATLGNGTEPIPFYRHSFAMAAMYCFAYLLVFAVGLVGNYFVIAVVYRTPRMRTVTNFFIVNLAVADILVIIFCLPATLLSNIFVREYASQQLIITINIFFLCTRLFQEKRAVFCASQVASKLTVNFTDEVY